MQANPWDRYAPPGRGPPGPPTGPAPSPAGALRGVASYVGSEYGPPRNDWKEDSLDILGFFRDLPRILDRLGGQPVWWPDSRPEGYKLRIGDLSPAITEHDLAIRLEGEMRAILAEMRDTLDVSRDRLGNPNNLEEEIRDVVLRKPQNNSGAAYCTVTFRSYRAAILGAVAIWRTWLSDITPDYPGAAPPGRRRKCQLNWLLPEIQGLYDQFGSARVEGHMGQPGMPPSGPRPSRMQLRIDARATAMDNAAAAGQPPRDNPWV